MSKPTITFEKTIRECNHNRGAIARGETAGLIYDYRVIDNGEHVAEFSRRLFRKGYELRDRRRDAIPLPGSPWRDQGLVCEKQDDFEAVYLDAKARDLIPSAKQIAAREEAERAERDAAEAKRVELNKLYRIKEAGPELLAALKALLDDNTGGTWGLPASHKDTIAARAAIAKAEGTTL